MKSHTPGPWNVSSGNIVLSELTDTGFEVQVATLRSGHKMGANDYAISAAESDRNALLIAAAPDLLEAAQQILSEHYSQPTAIHHLRTAIAKAKGNQSD